MLIQNKIHVQQNKTNAPGTKTTVHTYRMGRMTVGVMVGKLFNIRFKGGHSKIWRFNTEKLCMSIEANFFKSIGENDTGTYTRIGKKKRNEK